MCDPIADFFTQIRNGYRAHQVSLKILHSVLKEEVAKQLMVHGFIAKLTVQGEVPQKYLRLDLKYHGRRPVVEVIRQISKPGRRVYAPVDQIPRVREGVGITLVSTSQGVLDDREAKKKGLGGEIVGQVW